MPARGVVDPKRPHLTQCVVSFDTGMFQQIRDRAVRRKSSFAQSVRRLVLLGLEAEYRG